MISPEISNNGNCLLCYNYFFLLVFWFWILVLCRMHVHHVFCKTSDMLCGWFLKLFVDRIMMHVIQKIVGPAIRICSLTALVWNVLTVVHYLGNFIKDWSWSLISQIRKERLDVRYLWQWNLVMKFLSVWIMIFVIWVIWLTVRFKHALLFCCTILNYLKAVWIWWLSNARLLFLITAFWFSSWVWLILAWGWSLVAFWFLRAIFVWTRWCWMEFSRRSH